MQSKQSKLSKLICSASKAFADPAKKDGRPLTQGEIQLAKTVFGDSIEYDQVRIFDRKFFNLGSLIPDSLLMSPDGNIYAVKDNYCDDYSCSHLKATFIHEMTHVWQFQTGQFDPIMAAAAESLKQGFPTQKNYQKAYEYTLEKDKDLTDYGLEQQAMIVEGYFRLNQGLYPYRCKNSEQGAELKTLFEAVLKQFLANPAYTCTKTSPKPPKPRI